MAATPAPAAKGELARTEGASVHFGVDCEQGGHENDRTMVPHEARQGDRRGYTDPNRPFPMPTLAHCKSSEKFSFGGAARFPKRKSESPKALSGQTSTTASEVGGANEDFEEADDRGYASAPSLRHPPPPVTDKLAAPRIDGSSLRLSEQPEKAAMPRAKSYDPACSLGLGTSPTFHKFAHYSFGGGPSRVKDYDKVKEHLAHIPVSTGSLKNKGGKQPMAITMMDLKEATKSRRKQTNLSRGFGSQVRLKVKGGPMELPISPGPGAYEVPRRCDPEPVWASSSFNGRSCSWSRLTSERAKMMNPQASDIGPDHYVIDHPDIPFKAASPSPLFGHPLREPTKPEWLGSDPTRYEKKSSVAHDAPKYSVGTGKRPEMFGASGPGPATYNPEDYNGMRITGPHISFSKSVRQHESDLVDPDEPPGPGAHQVRVPKSTERHNARSGTLGRDAKMRKVPGLGPEGPGPGEAFRNGSPTTMNIARKQQDHCTFGIPLPRPIDETPGVGTYQVEDHLTTPRSPSYGCLLRTGKRPPPWREVEQPPVFELKSGEKLIMTNVPIQFQPSGPKWTMPPRRKDLKPDQGSEALILYTSLG